MSFYEDPCCRSCGRQGYTRKNCLACNTCTYCKEEGHLVHDCPITPPCDHCGVKGHKSCNCPQASTPRPLTRRVLERAVEKKQRAIGAKQAQASMPLPLTRQVLERAIKTKPQQSEAKRPRLEFSEEVQSQTCLNLSLKAPRHDDEEWWLLEPFASQVCIMTYCQEEPRSLLNGSRPPQSRSQIWLFFRTWKSNASSYSRTSPRNA